MLMLARASFTYPPETRMNAGFLELESARYHQKYHQGYRVGPRWRNGLSRWHVSHALGVAPERHYMFRAATSSCRRAWLAACMLVLRDAPGITLMVWCTLKDGPPRRSLGVTRPFCEPIIRN